MATSPNLIYPRLLDLFTEHRVPNRSDSAAFLIWYLQNYYRLDEQEAVDAVCDQSGDKGVDGVYVSDGDQTITVFQSRISQSNDSSIGDKPLREFAGTLSQFHSQAKVNDLIKSAGLADVAALLKRLEVPSKVGTYQLRGEFLSNIEIDQNGRDFITSDGTIKFVGRSTLEHTYISDVREIPPRSERSFDIFGFNPTEYSADTDAKAVIAPIKARELVGLDGIADQSLYAYNVRGPLGKTGVNKDIADSIADKSKHRLFPLFHNGITVIAGAVDVDKTGQKIKIKDYFVVNGCQSLTVLYENKSAITDDLRILTKFIKAEGSSPLATLVTDHSNNQNGVKVRDFLANNAIQIRLQNEVRNLYGSEFSFEIKRGESLPPNVDVLSNEDVGLMLLAFDIKEPWATHRKYQVFESKYADIFGRPEVTADRIIMCATIHKAIVSSLNKLTNRAMARYRLMEFFLLYVVRRVLESDEVGESVLAKPVLFVRQSAKRKKFSECVAKVLAEVIIDVNMESNEWGPNFDYRGKLRDVDFAKELAKKLVGEYLKQIQRGKTSSFAAEWKA